MNLVWLFLTALYDFETFQPIPRMVEVYWHVFQDCSCPVTQVDVFQYEGILGANKILLGTFFEQYLGTIC